MYTISNYPWRGLPANCTNGDPAIVAGNGISISHDAFWFLFSVNKAAMLPILYKED